jgi:hypothetical protein
MYDRTRIGDLRLSFMRRAGTFAGRDRRCSSRIE